MTLLQRDYELLQQSCGRYQDDVGHISTEAARLRIEREDMRQEQVNCTNAVVITGLL